MNTLRLRNNEPPAPRLSRCAAFTIIELLVVIGLMAILVSLVIPSLGRARGVAESVGCRANLRQMGTALSRHVADHRDRFAMYSSLWHRYANHADDNTIPRTLQLLSYIVDIEPGADPIGSGVFPQGWPHDRGNITTFATCPTMQRYILSDCIISSTYSYNIRAGKPLVHPSYQSAQASDPWDPVPSMSHVRSPSEMVAFADGMPTGYDIYVDGGWWYAKELRISRLGITHGLFPWAATEESGIGSVIPYVHNLDRRRGDYRVGVINLSFMDGRVDSRTPEELDDVVWDYDDSDEARRFWRGM